MELAMRVRTLPSRRRVVLTACLIGATWTFGALLPLGTPQSDPMSFLDEVRSLTFSAMLAVFALVAWLVVGLARPNPWVFAMAALMAIGGIVAGIGNFAEEMLRVSGTEYMYGLGWFPLLVGLVGTTIVLLVRREIALAILMFLSLAGFMIAAGRARISSPSSGSDLPPGSSPTVNGRCLGGRRLDWRA